jgi:acyl-CoA hydrolase
MPLRCRTADEAVQAIKSGDRVFVHRFVFTIQTRTNITSSIAAAPSALIQAMTRRHKELRNVEVCHIHTEVHPILIHASLMTTCLGRCTLH